MILAGLAATPLLVLAAKDGGRYAVPALAIFAASMILLYGASTTYHTFNISEKVNKVLRKIDHMMIFILIAGSYTPICVIPLRDTVGIPLLILVWAVAIAGMLIKAFWTPVQNGSLPPSTLPWAGCVCLLWFHWYRPFPPPLLYGWWLVA